MPSQTLTTASSHALLARARAVIPGGVNSPVRAFRAVGGTPRFIASAHGPWLVDVDGNRLVDLLCSWGPMILGHRHPDVLDAVNHAAAQGFSFGTPSEGEVLLAEEIVARVAPVEQVRLVSSGTEATMSAIRLARGFTGRDVIVKFAGCYHGHVDALLAAAGSGVATFALPDSAGVPADMTAETIVLPYNDIAALEAVFAARGGEIAAVITEAAPGNMGVVPPVVGFTDALRRVTSAHGALLISDEVMTGFRCSRAGWLGLEGVPAAGAPDLFTFGKVMGGGFPAAAFGGRADIMAHLAPEGPVYQAGTLSGNPVAAAAGLATLRGCTEDLYPRLEATATVIADAASAALTAEGVPHTVQWAGSMFSIFFREDPVRTYDDARAQDTAAFGRFFHAMLDAGVHLPPSAFEAWFVSGAHDDEALDVITTALPAAARAAAAADCARRAPGIPTPGGWHTESALLVSSGAGLAGRHTESALLVSSGAGGCREALSSVCDNHGMSESSTAHAALPRTVVHLLRHGEVHNPDRVLYGRLPDYHLSTLGRQMALLAAKHLADHDITHIVSSPLERARETASPVAEMHGLPVTLDERVIEAENVFEGLQVAGGQGLLKHPALLVKAWNPFRPSWGEPYVELAARMKAAIDDVRAAARGHEAVIVSHQAPIWTVRCAYEGRRFLHDPRKRECTLASLTSLTWVGDDLLSVSYSEPAASLLALAQPGAGA